MTLRHMKIFVCVCKENSITAAAKKLYISQPAVSHVIKDLEAHYGTPLFDRISKRLYLTQAGKIVYQYALHIDSLFEELEHALNHAKDIGQIKIGASITIGTHFIPDYIKKLSALYPDVNFYVTIDSSDNIERFVLENELDFGIIEGIVHSDHIVAQEFFTDELVVVCNLEHDLLKLPSVTIADLSKQPFLMREKNSGTRELAETILSYHNLTLKPLWESSSPEAIIEGVSRGIGISILPTQLVKKAISQGRIKQLHLDEITFNRQYQIIYHKNKYLSPLTKECITHCTVTI